MTTLLHPSKASFSVSSWRIFKKNGGKNIYWLRGIHWCCLWCCCWRCGGGITVRRWNELPNPPTLTPIHQRHPSRWVWCTPTWAKMLHRAGPTFSFSVPFFYIRRARRDATTSHNTQELAKTPRPWWPSRPPLQQRGVDGSTRSIVRATRPWCWARSRTKN